MTPAEYKLRYGLLPSWRRPLHRPDRDPKVSAKLAEWDAADRAASELRWLAEAVFDVLGAPMSRADLAARVLEDWGDFSDEQLTAALRSLVEDDAIMRIGELYARKE